MSANCSDMESDATARALGIHDILCQIFEADRQISRAWDKRRLSDDDLFHCALVSRAFCEPALRALWRTLWPPDGLWFLLAPPGSNQIEITSEFADAVLSQRTYADPARWARFMWYAQFVRTIRIIGSDLESKHRKLVYALTDHNGGASVFPSLQELQWTPSSYSDSSFFPLFTPQLYMVAFRIRRPTQEHQRRLDQDTESHTFLARLQATSPRLHCLCVDASWQRLGEHHTRAIGSFHYLVDLQLICSISTSSFRKLVAMPCLKTLQVGHVLPDSLVSSLSQRMFAPRLLFLSILGESNLIATLLNSLDAPILRAATVIALYDELDPPKTDLGYVRCLKALATFPLEETEISLYEPIPPTRMHLTVLLKPLLRLPGVTHIALSCPKLRLIADDDDFAAIARAWPRLRTFRLTRAHWYTSRAMGSGHEGGHGYTEVDWDIPTPEVLRVFRDLCPDLRDLVLPYLNLDAGVPQLDSATRTGPPHGLKRLVFGARVAATDNNEEEARALELAEREGQGVLDASKAEEWAREWLDRGAAASSRAPHLVEDL